MLRQSKRRNLAKNQSILRHPMRRRARRSLRSRKQSNRRTRGLPQRRRPRSQARYWSLELATQVVAVDVVVTDSSGHPVKGLAQKDFRVLEDGKPQNVRYFQQMAEANRPAVSVP